MFTLCNVCGSSDQVTCCHVLSTRFFGWRRFRKFTHDKRTFGVYEQRVFEGNPGFFIANISIACSSDHDFFLEINQPNFFRIFKTYFMAVVFINDTRLSNKLTK